MKYHPRRAEREITDREELQSILEKGKYGIIGLSKNDEPYVVTLSYGYDKAGNVLYFHCGKEGQKIDFLRSNSRACVTIIEDDGFDTDSCEHTYKSLIIRGKIQLENDAETINHAITLLISQLEKKDPGRFHAKLIKGNRDFDNLQILKLTIESITGKKKEKSVPAKNGPAAADSFV